MKTIVLSSLLSVSLLVAAGCKSKSASCEDVVAHTMSLMPAEMKSKIESGKADAIAKCEKASPEARKCALDAKALEDLMKCPRS